MPSLPPDEHTTSEACARLRANRRFGAIHTPRFIDPRPWDEGETKSHTPAGDQSTRLLMLCTQVSHPRGLAVYVPKTREVPSNNREAHPTGWRLTADNCSVGSLTDDAGTRLPTPPPERLFWGGEWEAGYATSRALLAPPVAQASGVVSGVAGMRTIRTSLAPNNARRHVKLGS